MAQVRTTRYVCDSCNSEVTTKKEIRKFAIQVRLHSWEEETSDLCADCETNLLNVAHDFFPNGLDVLKRETK